MTFYGDCTPFDCSSIASLWYACTLVIGLDRTSSVSTLRLILLRLCLMSPFLGSLTLNRFDPSLTILPLTFDWSVCDVSSSWTYESTPMLPM